MSVSRKKAPPNTTTEATPTVAVLLATYNAQDYLAEQLDSLLAQTGINVKIYASDDGSTDGTRALLERYQKKVPNDQLILLKGPQIGETGHFLALATNQTIEADFYAFADQDDVWDTDKLARGVAALKAKPKDTPGLYGSRTRIVDATRQPLGLSPLFKHKPQFKNALVQSLAGGNTMVFNQATKDLLSRAASRHLPKAHDWWLYILVSGAGGQVIYDPEPTMDYRQHGGNLVGSNMGPIAKLTRGLRLLLGSFQQFNAMNLDALAPAQKLLTPENQKTLEHFVRLRNASLLPRMKMLYTSGLHRQTVLDNLGLMAAALFNKL